MNLKLLEEELNSIHHAFYNFLDGLKGIQSLPSICSFLILFRNKYPEFNEKKYLIYIKNLFISFRSNVVNV